MKSGYSMPTSLCQDPALIHVITEQVIPTRVFNEKVSHKALVTLGEKLELSSAQRVRYNGFVFKLTDRIQDRLEVSRFYVSGSYGRRVTIGRIETDLIAFLSFKNPLPPYAESNDGLLYKLHAGLTKDFSRAREVTVYPIGLPASSQCPQNNSSNQYISVRVEDAFFRIFLAPALGKTSEEQRQATYRRMQEVYLKHRFSGTGALSAELISWYPALMERPSEEMAHLKSELQAFIRVCQYWVRSNGIRSIEHYAIETLAVLTARKVFRESPAFESFKCSRAREDENSAMTVDLFKAFKRFLLYCTDLTEVRQLCEIESPASYISPFTDSPPDVPILLDKFNPYCNLLASMTQDDQQQLSFSAHHTLDLLSTMTKGSSGRKVHQVFTATPRLHSRTLLQGFLRLVLWLVLVILVAVGVGLGYSWHLHNHNRAEMVENIWRDLAQIKETLISSWLTVGRPFFATIWQSTANKLSTSGNGSSD